MKETPVILVSGYLGAGKTTLINNLLREPDGKRLAVLVNEFGELAIDEDLIEAKNDNLISISGGCICCSFGDDLSGALSDLAKILPTPDYILIESSGVALPTQIIANVGLLDKFFTGAIEISLPIKSTRINFLNKDWFFNSFNFLFNLANLKKILSSVSVICDIYST